MKNQSPYFTTARFNSICSETGQQIRKGDRIAYFPNEKRAFHENSKAAEQIRELNFARTFNMADANW